MCLGCDRGRWSGCRTAWQSRPPDDTRSALPEGEQVRQLAIDDADAAFDSLLAEATPKDAANFVEALQKALDHLSRHPLTGSLRLAFELDIPELRAWPLNRFPYLVFYVCNDDHVDIWRILHAHRDIPGSIGTE